MKKEQRAGQEAWLRVFVRQDTPQYELRTHPRTGYSPQCVNERRTHPSIHLSAVSQGLNVSMIALSMVGMDVLQLVRYGTILLSRD